MAEIVMAYIVVFHIVTISTAQIPVFERVRTRNCHAQVTKADVAMAYIVMAHIVTAYIVMVHVVVAADRPRMYTKTDVVMAYVAMAYMVMVQIVVGAEDRSGVEIGPT